MKVLVISPQPFFSPRGTPFSVYYRTLVTAQLGANVDLLTYGEGQDVEIPGVRIVRIPKFGFLGNVKVGPSYLKLFLDIFIAAWSIALMTKNRYDVVHAHEESVFFCRFLKPVFGFKLIYDMHSSLPQQLTNFKFTRSNMLIGMFKKLENTGLRSADAVITICPDLAQYVDQTVSKNGRHFLIENSIFEPVRLAGHDTEAFSGNHKGRLSLDLPKDRRLVVYAGTLEPYQGIDILIEAFSKVAETVSDAALIIVGGTKPQVTHYSHMAHNLGLDEHVHFTGRVEPAVAKTVTASASVLVSPRSGGTNTPLKVYEQMACGIPLVATRIHSHTQVLNDAIAILVEPEPQAMADGIVKALEKSDRVVQMTQNARKHYENHYSRRIYEDKMRRVLNVVGPCAV
ncbi:MAG: glycosyltransferase family 4 protein [Desulfobacterales bacterium]